MYVFSQIKDMEREFCSVAWIMPHGVTWGVQKVKTIYFFIFFGPSAAIGELSVPQFHVMLIKVGQFLMRSTAMATNNCPSLFTSTCSGARKVHQ